MNATKRHCDCCPNIVEHIRQHYDPDGLTKPNEKPKDVLAIFQGCTTHDEPCNLDLDDVKEYLESLKPAKRAEN